MLRSQKSLPRNDTFRNDTFRNDSFFLLALTALLLLLPACRATYSRDKIKEQVAALAEKEYKLKVEVLEAGDTVVARCYQKNLSGEFLAGDQKIFKDAFNLVEVMTRVSLSMDKPPQFFVVEMVDADNTRIRLSFTQCVRDIKRYMAEAISVPQARDSFIMEFVIGDTRRVFDAEEMDAMRFLLMALAADDDATVPKPDMAPKEVSFPEFLAYGAANRARRLLRDRSDVQKNFILRQVVGSFQSKAQEVELLLDLVPRPSGIEAGQFLEKNIFPFVAQETAEFLRSYKYPGILKIAVTDKYSGKVAVFPK